MNGRGHISSYSLANNITIPSALQSRNYKRRGASCRLQTWLYYGKAINSIVCREAYDAVAAASSQRKMRRDSQRGEEKLKTAACINALHSKSGLARTRRRVAASGATNPMT